MNYLLTAAVAATLSMTSWAISAEPVDSKQSVQTQKDNLPESTSTGDYLETQPTGAGVSESRTEQDRKANKHNENTSKPNKMKKGKNQTEDVGEGGVDLKN